MLTYVGYSLWTLHHHIPLVNLSLPRRLPDLDGDGVQELLSAAAVTLPSGVSDSRAHSRTNLVSTNHLPIILGLLNVDRGQFCMRCYFLQVLISGASGEVIGRPYRVEDCLELGAVYVSERLEIEFDCRLDSGGNY